MQQLFYPESVLVIGVSEKPDNLAKNIVANLLAFGYRGRIYALGRERGEVYGVPIYDSFAEVPEGIDLAVILVPAPLVPGIVDECGRKGIRWVVVESGGFSEFSEERRALEEELLAVMRRRGIRLVGPNCISLVNMENGLCLPFVQIRREAARKGPVSVVAQSGGVAVTYFNLLSRGGVGFDKIVSVGNKLDLDEVDYLGFLLGDDATRIVCLYLESIERGRELVELAAGADKPVILHKANRFQTASEIARSHTAALANDDRIVDAAARQAGILRVSNFKEAVDCAKALLLPPCRGNRLAVLSRSGGHAVIAADAAGEWGFALPPFPQDFLADVMRTFRAKVIRPTNPLDLGDLFDFDVYVRIVERCLELPGFDAVVLIHVYSSYTERDDTYRLVRRVGELSRAHGKPVVLCLFSEGDEVSQVSRMFDYPIFDEIEGAFGALARALSWHSRSVANPVSLPSGMEGSSEAGRLLAGVSEGPLPLHKALSLLKAYGIPVADFAFAADDEELVEAARGLGFPLALKLVSPDVLHKTDVGGVALGIQSEDALLDAWAGMQARLRERLPEARVQGALVQRMVEGDFREVIVGGKRDPSFGPVVMFGLGGIYVEVLGDVSFRLAPLEHDEALRMMREVRAYPVLEGVRGESPVDLDALADVIVQAGRLLSDWERVQELDINPLLASSDGVVAVDARVVLG